MDKSNEVLSLTRHQISLIERKNITISGVKKIVSFDHEEFLLESIMGIILLKGINLEIVKLDTADGNVSIKGTINSINYIDDKKLENKESFISKLFK